MTGWVLNPIDPETLRQRLVVVDTEKGSPERDIIEGWTLLIWSKGDGKAVINFNGPEKESNKLPLATVQAIFPSAGERQAISNGTQTFVIMGSDTVLLALMERAPQDDKPCPTCEGGGWVQVYSERPPAFAECDTCHNPFNWPCP